MGETQQGEKSRVKRSVFLEGFVLVLGPSFCLILFFSLTKNPFVRIVRVIFSCFLSFACFLTDRFSTRKSLFNTT